MHLLIRVRHFLCLHHIFHQHVSVESKFFNFETFCVTSLKHLELIRARLWDHLRSSGKKKVEKSFTNLTGNALKNWNAFNPPRNFNFECKFCNYDIEAGGSWCPELQCDTEGTNLAAKVVWRHWLEYNDRNEMQIC